MSNLIKCENCDRDHNGEYGSGRFCSIKCARGFSTKNKRKEINEKVSKKLSKEPYKKMCGYCKTEFITKRKNQQLCSRLCVSKKGARTKKPTQRIWVVSEKMVVDLKRIHILIFHMKQ